MNALRDAATAARARAGAIIGNSPPAEAAVAVAPSPEPPGSSPEPVLGVCLSGGGSRALSAALGALSGLRSLADPDDPAQSVMDRVQHLSSVSGGSWASVAYTFLPREIGGTPVDDDDFLIAPIPPHQLVKSAGKPHSNNVEFMKPHCLGTAPQQFAPLPIARVLYTYWRWGMFKDRDKLTWFWIGAVGELILKPFDLYDAKYPRRGAVTQPARFFASSKQYFEQSIKKRNPDLQASAFDFVERERPSLVVNFNLLVEEETANSNQVPVQATPDLTGILGENPRRTIVGGGSVQSLGFGTELLDRGKDPDTARVEMERRYSLSDIAGCSSAFFAQGILGHLDTELDKIEAAVVDELKRLHVPAFIGRRIARFLCRRVQPILDEDAAALIPRYPYWPLGELEKSDPTTTPRGFSDGGTFDDTGVLGMLARTDASRIIAFVNGAAPITKDSTTNEIKIDHQLGDPAHDAVRIEGQMSTLFGYTWDGTTGCYRKYRDDEERRFAQVFSDEGGVFDALREGLWAASAGGGERAGTNTAAFVQHLTTIDNPVARLSAGRNVTVLWIVNNRVNAWQEQITDEGIKADLLAGQAGQTENGASIAGKRGHGPLENFPLYTTAGQIHLDKEAVNMLAQLSAWNVQQLRTEIEQLLEPDPAG